MRNRQLYDFSTHEGRHRFYCSKKWKNVRQMKLNLNTLCEECILENKLIPATDIDHVKDISERPDLALNIDNLKSLCHSCHSKKTYNTKKQLIKVEEPYKENRVSKNPFFPDK